MKLKKLGSNKTELTLNDGTAVLVSYSTPVACQIPGEGWFKTSTRHSVTTNKHIGSWVRGIATERPQSFFDGLL